MNRKKNIAGFATMLFVLTLTLQGTVTYAQEKELAEPKVIQPGKRGKAPSDAIVLFDRGSLSNFESITDGAPANWKVNGKSFTVNPQGTNIQTKQMFGDCQLHVEWRTPVKDVRAKKVGQSCGNSGVYLMGKYEIQVLNSYLNKTYFNGQAGAIYSNYPPLVNASLKPGKWQVYDIIFKAPTYNGAVKKPGYFTVFHNGVLVQNHMEISDPTTSANNNAPEGVSKLPLMLQNHGSEVSYRNIWIREL
jgi:Domain of Unknown Function (DUF1080)